MTRFRRAPGPARAHSPAQNARDARGSSVSGCFQPTCPSKAFQTPSMRQKLAPKAWQATRPLFLHLAYHPKFPLTRQFTTNHHSQTPTVADTPTGSRPISSGLSTHEAPLNSTMIATHFVPPEYHQGFPPAPRRPPPTTTHPPTQTLDGRFPPTHPSAKSPVFRKTPRIHIVYGESIRPGGYAGYGVFSPE